ncbi:MAG: hypothetical protein Q7V58_02085 [Actinomycetota bacterium]|nr:hypothetical protein [Actinomycetota bacterium]
MTKGPWWYSGDEGVGEPPSAAAAPEDPAAAAPADRPVEPARDSLDWSALAAGAQRLVEWATERVVAPHAEHDDPREHPDCVMCRALALMADRPGTASSTRSETVPDGIAWIPILGEDPPPEA